MSSQESEIRVRLLAGELGGIRIAELHHDDLQAVLIPRRRLCDAKQHTDRRLAVYLLLETTAPTVYIGQTDDAWERLNCHNRKKDWWKTAIALTSKTPHGLSHSDVKWLEWRGIQIVKQIEQHSANEIQRFRVENPNEPDEPSIPDAEQGGLCRIFGSLCTLVSVLGFPVFEPEEDFDDVTVRELRPASRPSSDSKFFCNKATGVFSRDGFVVGQGSLARLDVVPSVVKTVGGKQKELIDGGVLVAAEGGQLRFTRDYLFKSPSGAASIVLGRSADGWIEWENEHGKTLNEIVPRGGAEQKNRITETQAEHNSSRGHKRRGEVGGKKRSNNL